MAFTFSAPPTAAPSTGFSFGSGSSSTTAGGGFSFGSTPPATAPTATSFGGGLFGAPPASTGFFGTPSSTPAPSSVGLFGAPAPSSTFSSGGFFAAPSTAPTPALFGSQPQYQQQFQHQQTSHATSISPHTPYQQLPENAKKAIDAIYQLMMQHRRTLASIKTMAPALLPEYPDTNPPFIKYSASDADVAAGTTTTTPSTIADTASLPRQILQLHNRVQAQLRNAETNLNRSQQLKVRAGETVVLAKVHGLWPVEIVAARRGVALSSMREKTTSDGEERPGASSTASGGTFSSFQLLNVSEMNAMDAVALQQIMDIRAASVDRAETMPSPYFWEVLHDFEERAKNIQGDIDAMGVRLNVAEEAERIRLMEEFESKSSLNIYEEIGRTGQEEVSFSKQLATLARSQNDQFLRVAANAAHAHERLEEVKLRYRRFSDKKNMMRPLGEERHYEDPFLKADIEEMKRERELQQRILEEQLLVAASTQAPVPVTTSNAAPAPGFPSFGSAGGMFGAPAPSTSGLFGSTTATPATSLFGSPTPVSTGSGGLFGSTPAPTSTAPAAGGLFASPAPAPSTGLFGSTPASTSTPAGGLFGAPATTGGLFGNPAPASAAGGGLLSVPTTPASTLAPRKKPGSRSGGRRR